MSVTEFRPEFDALELAVTLRRVLTAVSMAYEGDSGGNVQFVGLEMLAKVAGSGNQPNTGQIPDTASSPGPEHVRARLLGLQDEAI